ncbi:HIG1 domain family member 2A-like [Oncorhynchus tshawytscha]|uniref:HIG1 domain family member 2A-like n=2 Tax=Oncorhynchus TaxID=8016 RepID=UPI001C3D94A4|nr:HIG1 domain family member 2A-like [Oncorhynchus tshawytscha]
MFNIFVRNHSSAPSVAGIRNFENRHSANMASATTPVVSEQSARTTHLPMLDISKPPVIEGFTPLSRPREETFQEKFMRKSKENPFVPIGCLGTAGALMYGLRAFKQGKTRQSQLLMRGRIFAQGFTVVAIIFGVFTTALKKD